MNPILEIQLISIIIAISCSLCGTFLVLKKMAMMSDSISHTILLGIVVAFFIVRDINSPILILGAAIVGVITVWLSETLTNTNLVREDSAIGIIFPLLFSIAIILITLYADNIHLDSDSVLLGEISFTPFNRLIINNIDLGPKSIYTGFSLLIINIIFIILFYKELIVTTFDPILSKAIGISPIIIHYVLMGVISITAVGSFESVGSILVVAFMVTPSIISSILTKNLKYILLFNILISIITGILGCQLALYFDINIGGTMTIILGIIFILVFIFSPNKGLFSNFILKLNQKKSFADLTLLMHIYNHQNHKDVYEENGIKTIATHLNWKQNKLNASIKRLINQDNIIIKQEIITLTTKGNKLIEYNIDNLLNTN